MGVGANNQWRLGSEMDFTSHKHVMNYLNISARRATRIDVNMSSSVLCQCGGHALCQGGGHVLCQGGGQCDSK